MEVYERGPKTWVLTSVCASKLAWQRRVAVLGGGGGVAAVGTGLRAQQNDWNPCCQVMAAQVMRRNASASLSRMQTKEGGEGELRGSVGG